MDGWLKFPRRLKDLESIWSDDRKVRMYLYLLMGAAIKPGFAEKKFRKPVKVEVGQYVTSTLSLSKKFKLNRRTVVRTLDCLEEAQLLTQRRCKEYTVITHLYDNFEGVSAQGHEQRPAQGSAHVVRKRAEKKQLPVKSHPVVDQWNKMAESNGLPSVEKVTDQRISWIKARLSDPAFKWAVILGIIPRSPHLLGQNDRGWRATFDWIFKGDNNWPKVLEGNYEQGSGAVAVKTKLSAFDTFCGPHCIDANKIKLYEWIDDNPGLTLDKIMRVAKKGGVSIVGADELKLKEWLDG